MWNEGIRDRMKLEKLKQDKMMERQGQMKWWVEMNESGERYQDELEQEMDVQN